MSRLHIEVDGPYNGEYYAHLRDSEDPVGVGKTVKEARDELRRVLWDMESNTITVTLTPWQLAQCKLLVEDQINTLKRDGLATNSVTRSMEALLTTLNNSQ